MKDYKQFNREEKISFWGKHLEACKVSGLSQKKYCEKNAISYWNFKTWYSKLKTELVSEQNKFIKIKSGGTDMAYSGKIELIFPNNIKIIVEESIPENSLKNIFSAIGYSHD